MIRLPRTADYFLTVPAFEVTALQRYLDLMDRNLAALVEQDPEPEWDGRPETGGSAMVAQLYHEVVSTMLPQVFRSSFVLVLYATFEAAVTETADVLRQQHGRPTELPANSSFLKAASRYFHDEFSIELLPADSRDKIHVLKRVRDALVHANGRKGAMKASTWDKLASDRDRGAAFSLEDGYIRLEQGFLVDMLLAVRVSLRSLITAARDSLEEAARGPNAAHRPKLDLGGIGRSG
ncbi:MAG: hypothetical protein ACR2GG_06200 [Gemmatimonadaceae bacterium]